MNNATLYARRVYCFGLFLGRFWGYSDAESIRVAEKFWGGKYEAYMLEVRK
jgi:hypothetical protein